MTSSHLFWASSAAIFHIPHLKWLYHVWYEIAKSPQWGSDDIMSASRVIPATLANLIDCPSTRLDVMSQGGQLCFFGPGGPTYLPTCDYSNANTTRKYSTPVNEIEYPNKSTQIWKNTVAIASCSKNTVQGSIFIVMKSSNFFLSHFAHIRLQTPKFMVLAPLCMQNHS
ncbi:hypothetical protein EDD85DRAFT_794462 [Armillaria nabsnona]|nr:hypothetical protein EDD85DRAFT_794462 [Armillaria nabsnona]